MFKKKKEENFFNKLCVDSRFQCNEEYNNMSQHHSSTAYSFHHFDMEMEYKSCCKLVDVLVVDVLAVDELQLLLLLLVLHRIYQCSVNYMYMFRLINQLYYLGMFHHFYMDLMSRNETDFVFHRIDQ
jgi:hypothetical protein